MPDAPDARYLVTARKYRPALFREVVAQEHVTDTLKNALRTERLAHAYLFSGPRGVGKTTAARILAKAINCTTPLGEREDEAEPCRACESCRSFEEGRSLGIFELDAASNNKVDDIRELRETVRVPPQGTRRKVYIIDEVHMLSNQAFNALLKTLEEPPPHVLFIFATTEPHKVLPTILSRCQRFDFRRIRAGRIAEHLRWVCEREGIDADEGSLMLLARKGDGALRDALSAFDQAISLCGDVLRYDELAQALGVVDADLYFRATDHVREGHSAGMLRLVEDVVGRGYDLQEFLAGLSEHLRNLLVAHTMDDASLIEATEAMRRRYTQSARPFAEDDLLRLLMIAGETEDAVKQSVQPRLRLEMALLNMASLPRAADLQEALSTLRRLETMARDGQLADLPETPPPGAPSSPETAPERETTEQTTEPEKPTAEKTAEKSEPADSHASAEQQTAGQQTYDEAPPSPGRVQEPPAEAASAEAASEEDASEEDAQATEEQARFGDLNPEAASRSQNPSVKDASGENASGENAPAAGAAPASPEHTEEAPPEYDDLFGPPALSDQGKKSGQGKPSGGDGAPRNAGVGSTQAPAGVAPAPLEEPPARGEAPGAPGVERLRAHWDTLVQNVRADRIDLASCLGDATPMSLSAGTLTVAVPNQFSRRFLLDQESFLLDHVEKHLPENATVPSALHLTLAASSSAEDDDDDSPTDPRALMQRLREEHPVVRTIFEEFGGEMAW